MRVSTYAGKAVNLQLLNFSQMTHFRQEALVAGQPTGGLASRASDSGQLPVKPQTINAYDRLFI